jgi:hypothetical protein
MNTIAKLLIPAALSFSAFGIHAQTIETDYPRMPNAVAVEAPAQVAASDRAAKAAPYLIQSNAEGARVNPAYEQASTLSRAEVQASAVTRTLQGPGHSA